VDEYGIVKADLGGIIWVLIIVGSIVGQIVKGMKKVNSSRPGQAPSGPPPPAAAPRPSAESPADDLETFLKNLMGEGQAESERPPAPAAKPRVPPLPRPAQPKPRPARTPPAPVRPPVDIPAFVTPAAPVPPVPAAVAVAEIPSPEPRPVSAGILGDATAGHGAVRSQLSALLKSGHGLRSAYLLREVFGPPLALRTRTSRYPGWLAN
jgi:hypothetical protein